MGDQAKKFLNDTLSVKRAAISPMSFTKPYWEATREKKLVIQFCPETKRYQFYPRPMSIFTGKRNLEWREVPGNGIVFSYTITRRALPPFRGHEPFALAMVELDEGVRIMGDLIHVAEDDIKIGMKVKPFWIPLPDGYNLLAFTPR